MTQRLRDSGVASRNSSRPDVSSEAQTATSVAAARPARIMPELDEEELQEPADRSDVEAGEHLVEQLHEVGRLAELVDERLARAGDRQPEQADPDAPGDRGRQVLADRPPGRSLEPDERPRQARRRDRAGGADIAPGERLDADDEEDRTRRARRGAATPSRTGPRAGCGSTSSRTRSGSPVARSTGSRPGSRSR